MLTIQGGSFPERVASSLYKSLADGSSSQSSTEETDAWDLHNEAATLQNSLVTYSIKQYVSTAIELAKSRQGVKLGILKSILWRCILAERGPFNALEHNRKFLTSISVLEDEKILNQGILSKLSATSSTTKVDEKYHFQHSPIYSSNKRWNLIVTNS